MGQCCYVDRAAGAFDPQLRADHAAPSRHVPWAVHRGVPSAGIRENLNFSADALRAESQPHFALAPGKPAADEYARQPARNTNYVDSIACHPDLGNTEPVDGQICRGVGRLLLMGRAMNSRFARAVETRMEAPIDWM